MESVDLMESLKGKILKYYGEKCPDYCDGCVTCRVWFCWEVLKDNLEFAEDRTVFRHVPPKMRKDLKKEIKEINRRRGE